ncbi:MAG: NAD-dependent epimerase/dehydratase family protein [Bacteroidetes bacterium]|nr:NAD-dependent epimerase/dehydratase family protein [Bacteroidota bacterium]
MQTILGSGGIIATHLASSLPAYSDKVRLVSRNPKHVTGNEQLMSSDLTQRDSVMKAVEGSNVVYLTAGLVYNIKVWQSEWPGLMQNVIDACEKHGAKLVFFDNVYMYGKVNGWMTEETAYNPCSRKGEIRAKIASMILDEVKKGNLTALIARAADFYGPHTANSFLNAMVFDNIAKGKNAQLMISKNLKHSFSYTPDAGKATALLGNTAAAFNQTWHLPADRNVITTGEIVKIAADSIGKEAKITILPKWMIQAVGIFNPIIRESVEMLYQYDSDYLFDSTKFDKAFKFEKTPYPDGIKTVMSTYSNK